MGQINLLDKKLPRGSLVGIDTNVFIYHFGDHSKFGGISTQILKSIERGRISGITSVVTVIELLYRTQERSSKKIGLDYKETLCGIKNLSLYFVDLDVAQKAAELRWKYHLHTPDAIQLATAVISGCKVFITNDVRFRKVKEISVLLFSDFVSPKSRKTKRRTYPVAARKEARAAGISAATLCKVIPSWKRNFPYNTIIK